LFHSSTQLYSVEPKRRRIRLPTLIPAVGVSEIEDIKKEEDSRFYFQFGGVDVVM
jgi:hypothetical protein